MMGEEKERGNGGGKRVVKGVCILRGSSKEILFRRLEGEGCTRKLGRGSVGWETKLLVATGGRRLPSGTTQGNEGGRT